MGARKVVKEQIASQKERRVINLVRSFFASQGQIATVYVQLYESNEDKLVGGVVLEDDRHITLSTKTAS